MVSPHRRRVGHVARRVVAAQMSVALVSLAVHVVAEAPAHAESGGGVVAWGLDSHGQADPGYPRSRVTQVAAGLFHSIALRSGGSVVAWGRHGARRAANRK